MQLLCSEESGGCTVTVVALSEAEGHASAPTELTTIPSGVDSRRRRNVISRSNFSAAAATAAEWTEVAVMLRCLGLGLMRVSRCAGFSYDVLR